jgi:hypothetical protein
VFVQYAQFLALHGLPFAVTGHGRESPDLCLPASFHPGFGPLFEPANDPPSPAG